MDFALDGALEAPVIRRRASTDASLGLDYQNTNPVDDDILTRIRALLLSRNGHRPPLTPHTSEENPARSPRENNATQFDFSTAKSISKLARKATNRMKPGLTRTLSKSADMANDHRPSQPLVPSNLARPLLRTSSSVNDMRGPYDDTPAYKAEAASKPSGSTETTKKSWFPRLVLRDIKAPDTSHKSCVEISKFVPPNDLEIHQDELACCPPCIPLEPHESKYMAPNPVWPGQALMAEPADLVCFLAGCPAGHLDCKKNHRIPSMSSHRSSREGSEEGARSRARSRTTSWARSSARQRHSVAETRSKSRSISIKGRKDSYRRQSNIEKAPKFTLAVQDAGKNLTYPVESSPRSSITSADRFPHVLKSMDEAANETWPAPFSTSIATNFILSSPRHKPTKSKDVPKETPMVPQKLSRALPGPTVNSTPWKHLICDPKSDHEEEVPKFWRCLRKDGSLSNDSLKDPRPGSTSLRSGASRTSSYRHFLLKPSVTESQPVDNGLPVPPVLSATVGMPEISMPLHRNMSTVKESAGVVNTGHQTFEAHRINPTVTSSPMDKLVNLSSEKMVVSFDTVQNPGEVSDDLMVQDSPKLHSLCLKEAELYRHIKKRTQEAKDEFQVIIANDGGNSSIDNRSSIPEVFPAFVDSGAPASPAPSSLAAYWGFVPTVKEVVHDAVNLAVRNVVSESLLPKGTEKEKAARAYRRAVAESLVEAAKDVDIYLRRPSLWKDPEPHESRLHHDVLIKPCHRLTCLDDPHTGIVHCNSISCGKELASKPTPEPQVVRVPTDLKIKIPVQSAAVKAPQKQLISRNASRALRKNSAAPVSVIPDRGSSRHRSSVKEVFESTPIITSTKKVSVPRSQRRPYKALGSGSRQTDRSSAAESLDDAKQDLPKQSLLPRRDEESEAESLSYLPSNERLGRKNTVHWLRTLLSTTGPYEPRLTALPPRTRRGQDSSGAKLRSQTAPTLPVKDLYLGVTPKPKPAVANVQKSPDQDLLIPEAISKTIGELEDLLSEALVMTRKAAGGKSYQAYSKVEPKTRGSRQSDEISLVGSVHESMGSFSGSTDGSDDSMEEENQALAYDQTREVGVSIEQQPKARDCSSGWPPTGRVVTPYPPSTRRSSKNSVEADTADLDDMESTADSKTPSSIVRKIDPRLRSIGPTLRAVTQMSFSSPPKKNEPIEFQNLEPFNGGPTKRSQNGVETYSPGRLSPDKTPVESNETASRTLNNPRAPLITDRSGTISPVPMPKITPRGSKAVCRRGHSEDDHMAIKQRLTDKSVPSKREVRDYILKHRRPPIHVRESSRNSTKMAKQQQQKESQPENKATYKSTSTGKTYSWQDIDPSKIAPCSHIMPEPAPRASQPRSQQLRHMSIPYSHSFDGTQFTRSEEVDFNHQYGQGQRTEPGDKPTRTETAINREREEIELRDVPNPNLPTTISRSQKNHMFNLKNKRHVSLREIKGFSLARSHKRQSIARDWSTGRKRFCAAIACLSTSLVGILVGIYAGETPAIQYWIVDFHHYTVLGNVFFFIGLSIPSFLFWPLPLLHGRKPYILGAMSLAMPLLFPQALAVGELRSPYTHVWRVALIMPRAFMGFCLGFANMNFKGILTDLFGASLQSTNPHQEHVDEFDVRRHGGGMGVWLGFWTWSAMGSIGVGFLIGGAIINNHNPAWGFYISIVIIAIVLLLNVLTPEVRRSAFRRSVAEVQNNGEVSRRLARGEVKMHMVQTGPKWWGEEFYYGIKLSLKMLRQPGFMVMAMYVAWMYGQIVLIVLLLGSLCSNTYKFQSPQVGLSVASVPLGAFLAIPFQKASLFSRERDHAPKSDDDTYKKKVKWSSHFIRRAIFVLTLPFAGLGYTLTSGGTHIPFILPILFAALIGFLSNLAMAECHGLIMETYDTSDLSPGMTGRSRGSAGGKPAGKRTNYSSFPRVASAFGITQGLGYLIAAIASGVGGSLTRNLGQQAATGVMAFILLILSVLLLGILIRFKDVQIIPDSKKDEMDRYHKARQDEGPQTEEPWRPIIIGNPHHSTRRMCILELGSMSRFSEIRLKNRLVDEQSLDARHMMHDVHLKIKEKENEIVHHVRRSLSRHSSRGSRRSLFSGEEPEPRDLGGHREISTAGGRVGSQRRGTGRRATRRGTGFRD